VQRFQAEQQGEVEVGAVGDGRRRQLPRAGDARLLGGGRLLVEGEPGQAQGDQSEEDQGGDEQAQAVGGAPPQGDTGVEVGDLVGVERQAGAGAPGLELGQAVAGGQVAGIASGVVPFQDGGGQAALGQQVGAVLLQPALQPIPCADQSLMGHLDGWLAGLRVVVEGEQAVAAKEIQNLADGRAIFLPGQGEQRAPLDALARGLCALADGYQAQQHLAGELLARRRELLVQLVGAAGQRPGDAAGHLVSGVGQSRVLPPLEQIGQGVLQQRQRAGLLDHVVHQGAGQDWLDDQPGALRRADDGLLQLAGAHRQDDLGLLADQVAEIGVE